MEKEPDSVGKVNQNCLKVENTSENHNKIHKSWSKLSKLVENVLYFERHLGAYSAITIRRSKKSAPIEF